MGNAKAQNIAAELNIVYVHLIMKLNSEQRHQSRMLDIFFMVFKYIVYIKLKVSLLKGKTV